MSEQPPKRSRRLQPGKIDVDPASWTTWLVPLLAFAVIAILAPGNLAPGQLEWSRFGGVLVLLAVLGILAYRKWGSKP